MEYYKFASELSGLKIRVKAFFLICMLTFIITVTGCQANSTNTGSTPQPAPYFPVQKRTVIGASLDLGMSGTLAIENNCVRILSTAFPGEPFYGSPSISSLPVWPYGYSLDTKGKKIQILDEKSQPIAVIGDFVYLDVGGESSRENIESLINSPLQAGIPGPYRVVFYSDHPLELVQNIPHHLGIKPDSPELNLEGTLILDMGINKGNLRLDIGNGNNVFLIWPPGYYCRIENYITHVVDKDGKSIAAVDDKLKINGAVIPPDLWGKYTNTPSAGIPGPYWFVDGIVRE